MNKREFGVRLTRAREQKQLSITQLAGQTDVDYMQISRYERGQSLPSFDTAIRLAKALDVSLDLLVSGIEIPQPAQSFTNPKVLARMRDLEALPKDRQALALRLLEAVIAGELDALATRLRG